MKSLISTLMLSVVMVFPSIVSAESAGEGDLPATNSLDAARDERLPPVFPGEEVRDGDKTLKVWSTAGSVNGIEATAHPRKPNSPHAARCLPSKTESCVNDSRGSILGDIGVIVDQRTK